MIGRANNGYPSLRKRLIFAALSGITVAVVIPFAAIIYLTSMRPSEADVREQLLERLDSVEDGIRFNSDVVRVFQDKRLVDSYDAMTKDSAYLVSDENGRPVAHSPPGKALAYLLGERSFALDRELELVGLQTAHRRIVHDGVALQVDVAATSRMINAFRAYAGSLYMESAAVTTCLALFVFSILTYLTTTKMLAPLLRASHGLGLIGPGNLAGRVAVEGVPAELLPLVEALNDALGRLEQGYRAQREFLGAAAHELKTPLALIQAELQLSDLPNKNAVLQDVKLMGRQVHQLLHLAEAVELHNYHKEDLSVLDVIDEAIAYMTRSADQKAVCINSVRLGTDAVLVKADRGALFMLVRNLLENAVYHSPVGGMVWVEVGETTFSVVDEGEGVAPANRSKVFERFWRASKHDLVGAGLGLAICKEICEAHGWEIELAAGDGSRGATFTVRYQ